MRRNSIYIQQVVGTNPDEKVAKNRRNDLSSSCLPVWLVNDCCRYDDKWFCALLTNSSASGWKLKYEQTNRHGSIGVNISRNYQKFGSWIILVFEQSNSFYVWNSSEKNAVNFEMRFHLWHIFVAHLSINIIIPTSNKMISVFS